MTTNTIEPRDTPSTARLHSAFNLVCPAEYANRLVAAGLITAADATTVSWKDNICALVTDEDLVVACVTIDDVKAAVSFMTATDATVTREQIGSNGGQRFSPAKPGYMVRAIGYNAGPCGDR